VQILFAGHTLDADRHERRRGARPIAVEPQVFDWLADSVQNRDRAVREDDLLASSVAVGSSRIRPLPAAPMSRASMLWHHGTRSPDAAAPPPLTIELTKFV
jgi:hypothetical protein